MAGFYPGQDNANPGKNPYYSTQVNGPTSAQAGVEAPRDPPYTATVPDGGPNTGARLDILGLTASGNPTYRTYDIPTQPLQVGAPTNDPPRDPPYLSTTVIGPTSFAAGAETPNANQNPPYTATVPDGGTNAGAKIEPVGQSGEEAPSNPTYNSNSWDGVQV